MTTMMRRESCVWSRFNETRARSECTWAFMREVNKELRCCTIFLLIYDDLRERYQFTYVRLKCGPFHDSTNGSAWVILAYLQTIDQLNAPRMRPWKSSELFSLSLSLLPFIHLSFRENRYGKREAKKKTSFSHLCKAERFYRAKFILSLTAGGREWKKKSWKLSHLT